MIDDKPHLLAKMKQVLGDMPTTLFVRQGHYAIAGNAGIRPAPDRDIACIGELRHCVLTYFLLAAAVPESNETNRTMEQA